MSLPLPPDPYKALGVAKDAAVSEVKSAYRKLVLKCHPDKVQDPTLKAQKQDEFQKVQQAYELLTDDAKRTEYDEKLRMFAFRDTLRSQVPKSSPQSARSSPAAHSPPVFDYEVRTAEPRSSRFNKTSRAPSPVRVYATARPASFEDDLPTRMYDMGSSRSARKAASYEDRKVFSREEERSWRAPEDRRERERREKDLNKKNLSASKKSRDKERRKGVEEKTSSRHAPFIVDDDSEDGFRSPRSERRSSKKSDDKIHVTMKGGETNEFIVTERTRKLHLTKDNAAQYILNAKSKAKGKSLEDEFRPSPVRRSETYHGPPSSSRYPVEPRPIYVEADSDDEPRRSSARPRSRRPSDALPQRVPPGNEPYIVTADPSSRKPSLQTHSSAPPLVAEPRRKEPQRSQTIQSEYSRRSSASVVPPPLPRASTFDTKPRPSRLQTEYTYPPSSSSSDSDSDVPRYASPSRSSRHSPPAQSGTQKRYVIDKSQSRAVPVAPRSSHRKVFREESFLSTRDRSESPRGTPTRVPDRPPVTRSSTSSARASSSVRTSSSRAPAYYASPTDDAPPRKRDLPRGVQQQPGAGSGGAGPYFGEVKYAPAYSAADVTYGDYYRPGQTTDYYPQSRRGEAAAAYA
ncbi:hypothetical protein V498_03753 [Pseudogymnoascus sp. VKM F-4517 (FW-2822)]|nr:hypothetical protein V498_03753 [Pseudogymnoascus sp. VKM F-4517 (FW-2822)]